MWSFPHWGPDCRDAIGWRQGTLLLLGIERVTHDVRVKLRHLSTRVSLYSPLYLARDAAAFFLSWKAGSYLAPSASCSVSTRRPVVISITRRSLS